MHLSLYYEFFTAPRPISAGKHGSHLTSAEPDGLDRDPDRNEHATPKEPARSQPGPRRGNRAPVANFAAVSKLARMPSYPSGSPPPSTRPSAVPGLRQGNGRNRSARIFSSPSERSWRP